MKEQIERIKKYEELLRHGFEDLKLERIWCAYYEGNEKSKSVQEKLGFKHFATKENVPVTQLNETRTDHINLLTKEEWLRAYSEM